MKTAQIRDIVVSRVQEAHKKWPSFEKMPELTEPTRLRATLETDPDSKVADGQDYVAALYELCGRGAVPAGRYKRKDGDERIIGGNPLYPQENELKKETTK